MAEIFQVGDFNVNHLGLFEKFHQVPNPEATSVRKDGCKVLAIFKSVSAENVFHFFEKFSNSFFHSKRSIEMWGVFET